MEEVYASFYYLLVLSFSCYHEYWFYIKLNGYGSIFWVSLQKPKTIQKNGNIKIRNKLKTLHIHNNLGFATYRRMMRLINRFWWPPIIRYTSYEAIIGDLRRPKRAELRDKVLFLLYSNSSLIIVHICCSLSFLDNVEKKKKKITTTGLKSRWSLKAMVVSPPSTPGVQGSRAWVTLVTNPAYVAGKWYRSQSFLSHLQGRLLMYWLESCMTGLLTLHRTLSSLSSYPLLVMTTPSLPATHSSLLRSLGLNLIPVSHLSPSSSQHPGFDPSFSRFNDAWTKLQVFGLTEYDKVILIDCDMIFLKDMDELFDLELPGRDWIGASPACVCNPLKLEHYPKDW